MEETTEIKKDKPSKWKEVAMVGVIILIVLAGFLLFPGSEETEDCDGAIFSCERDVEASWACRLGCLQGLTYVGANANVDFAIMEESLLRCEKKCIGLWGLP
jgi:hypothetical protein